MTNEQSLKATPYVFTYGSLMSGMWYHNCLRGGELVGNGTTKEKYNLLAVEFPFLIKDEPIVRVKGELYKVDSRVLRTLDRLESHPSGYEREITKIIMDDGSEVEAWLYFVPRKRINLFANPSRLVAIDSGDFRVYAKDVLKYKAH